MQLKYFSKNKDLCSYCKTINNATCFKSDTIQHNFVESKKKSKIKLPPSGKTAGQISNRTYATVNQFEWTVNVDQL